ncbi:recombinase family protein, partial [Shigella flexneri]|nr:recombinase family protein [Salmonella enterica]ECC8255534.1 recombinase family protein [Salmonella enterica]EFY3248227.1 recombinase family protein [Shigella flexneri]
MSNVGYIRVSTVDQNTERQLDGVTLDKVFTEKASGKNTDRDQLQAMMNYVREGDTLHVHSIDRLGRNSRDLLNIVEDLKGRGVKIQFHKEGLLVDGANPFGEMMLTVLAGVAQMERSMMLMRQREAYDVAKSAGKSIGRGNSSKIDRTSIIADLQQGKSLRNTAKDNGVSLNTVYRIQQEAKEAGSL